MLQRVKLEAVTRDDINRLSEWLEDDDINRIWYGRDESNLPNHVGYVPTNIINADDNLWKQTFSDARRKIFSIYVDGSQHIGEGHILLEPLPRNARIFVLVGRKDLWYQGFGTAAMVQLLDEVFYTYNYHRAWVDVPEYNKPALHMCDNIGFVTEGHLKGRHQMNGAWYDTLIMGLLVDEYTRRRARFVAEFLK